MIRFTLSLLISAMLLIGSVAADVATFTSQSDFLSALPVTAQLSGTDFESMKAPHTIVSGSGIDGITFNYALGGPEMIISDMYTTTSGDNFLGTTDSDIFISGDSFSLGFALQNAIGMHFITEDILEDDDISLTFGGTTVSLDSMAGSTLSDNVSKVFFLGIINTDNQFSTASVNSNGQAFFFFNVDDIVLAAIPEPSSLLLLGIGCIALGCRRRKN